MIAADPLSVIQFFDATFDILNLVTCLFPQLINF